MSSACRTLAAFQISLPVYPIVGIIFFEPVHLLQPVLPNDSRIARGLLNVKGVQARRETFESSDDARQWTRKRMPWKTWDQRMFNSYMVCSPTIDILSVGC